MKANAGISLLEICIALIIVGLIMAPIIASYNQQVVDNDRGTTSSNLAAIDKAIQNYYVAYNKLPCPADPGRSESNGPNGNAKTYGQSDCVASVVAGFPTVLTGSVPFVDLRLSALTGYDGWGNRISYTVTKADTTAPLDTNNKTVLIKGFDSSGNPTTGSVGSYYILVSAGADGAGAYTAAGTQNACPAATVRENENCNKDDTFLDPNYAFSTSGGTTQLDDMIEANYNLAPGIWTYVPIGQSGSVAYKDIFTADYVGIKTGATPVQYPLDVGGNIKVAGNATGTKMCDASGNNCFPAAMIAGAGIGAGPSNPSTTGCQAVAVNGSAVVTPMVAIKTADANCNTQSALLAGHAFSCPAGKYVTQISAQGVVTCGP